MSGGAETQLDLVLMRPARSLRAVDCKAIPGVCCAAQHRPVRADIKITGMKRRKVEGRKKLKMWKLRDPALCDELRDKLKEKLPDCGELRSAFQDNLLDTCREICG